VFEAAESDDFPFVSEVRERLESKRMPPTHTASSARNAVMRKIKAVVSAFFLTSPPLAGRRE
jgi:hypothetical protein